MTFRIATNYPLKSAVISKISQNFVQSKPSCEKITTAFAASDYYNDTTLILYMPAYVLARVLILASSEKAVVADGGWLQSSESLCEFPNPEDTSELTKKPNCTKRTCSRV